MLLGFPDGGFPAPVHGVFEVLAVVAGVRLYAALRRRAPDVVSDERRLAVLVAGAAGALVGSRALAALEHLAWFDGLSTVQATLFLVSTKTIVGGLLGGLLAVEGTKRALGIATRTGDLFVYPLILAIAVGRVGCFLTGATDATVGLPTDLPWGLDHGDGVARHPTALYEIAFLGVLALALRTLARRRALAPGALFAAFLSAYLAWRLVVDLAKPTDALALGLSAIQWACVLGLLHYARLFLGGHLAGSRPEPAALP